jgi:hypothetical protein
LTASGPTIHGKNRISTSAAAKLPVPRCTYLNKIMDKAKMTKNDTHPRIVLVLGRGAHCGLLSMSDMARQSLAGSLFTIALDRLRDRLFVNS